jgi:hypothetical protein
MGLPFLPVVLGPPSASHGHGSQHAAGARNLEQQQSNRKGAGDPERRGSDVLHPWRQHRNPSGQDRADQHDLMDDDMSFWCNTCTTSRFIGFLCRLASTSVRNDMPASSYRTAASKSY